MILVQKVLKLYFQDPDSDISEAIQQRKPKKESRSKQVDDRDTKTRREQKKEKPVRSRDRSWESDKEVTDDDTIRSRSDGMDSKVMRDQKKEKSIEKRDRYKDSDRDTPDSDDKDVISSVDQKREKTVRYDDEQKMHDKQTKDEDGTKTKDKIGHRKKSVSYEDEAKKEGKQMEREMSDELEDMQKTLNDLNSMVNGHKSSSKKKGSGFDPTKANVNGVSIDDDKYSDGKPDGEADDSRRSSYDTSGKRKSSVHGGYRQPNQTTNGLDSSRATDAGSALKDSGYSDGSRLETPDGYLGTASSTDYDSGTPFDRQRQKKFGGGDPEDSSFEDAKDILKTITDEYDETLEDDYYQRVFSDAPVRPHGLEEPRLFNDKYGIPLDIGDEEEGISGGKKSSKGYRSNIGRGGGMRMSMDGDGFEPVEQHNKDKSNNLYRNSMMRCPPNLPEAPKYLSRAPKPPDYSNPGVGFEADKRISAKKPNLISPEFIEGQDR